MKRSLLTTNPYLKDPQKREEAMARNIETSSAIEGIKIKRISITGCFVHADHITAHPRAKRSSRPRSYQSYGFRTKTILLIYFSNLNQLV
ncbi:hypothetical protein Ppro_1006 [Pelobacter propionicus DSM 2379]|uniref:Uncharacterized protein n=1 Tax=Pelobacter propionicus (strain DSM 2379 / NBRC 103807 / OttBd1) TaxID=338966 RepID=A1AMR3_PELPD|nr:hypothetical protein Ppro_1006 [Pelobacter propionicus DSM 2379]